MNDKNTYRIYKISILFCFAFIILLSMPNRISAQKSADVKAAAEIVDRLFVAMQEKDTDTLKDIFVPDAQFVAVINPRDGKGEPTTRTNTVEGFANSIARGQGEVIERMPNKDVVISDNLAFVSGRYTLYIGERFSHCGINTFNLFRTKTGWKILSLATTFEFDCERDLKNINVPEIAADKKDVSTIDSIIKALYETISGDVGEPRQWGRDRTLYTPDVRFISINSGNGRTSINRMTHQEYVNNSDEFMVKSGFTEREIHRVTRRFGNIAHVFSTYEWETADKKQKGRGINSIELFYDGTRWWISALSWENEHKDNPIPKEFLPTK